MFEVKGGAYTYVNIGLSFGDTILGGRQGSLKPQPLIKLRRGPRLGGIHPQYTKIIYSLRKYSIHKSFILKIEDQSL